MVWRGACILVALCAVSPLEAVCHVAVQEALSLHVRTFMEEVENGKKSVGASACLSPPWEWVEHLWQQVREAGCLVYWKSNLHTRPQEYPGQVTRVR
jgi:hypothetical protein